MNKKQLKANKKIKIKNKKLTKEYPFLIPRDFTGKIPKDYDYTWTELDCLPYGWRKLAINLCRELKPLLIKANCLDKYYILEAKEKYAQLRWYSSGYPKSISEAAFAIERKYEKLSEQTCIMCGKSASIITIGGWYEPYCEKCNRLIKNKLNTGEF